MQVDYDWDDHFESMEGGEKKESKTIDEKYADKAKEFHTDLPPGGINRKRGSTDCLCLIVFFIFVFLMCWCSIYASE